MSRNYDNWERLVGATLKREEYRRLALEHSREPSFSSSVSESEPGSPLLDDYYHEERPGIEGLQIVGWAEPGNRLLGCGYPVRGTTLCMFQWVRYYPGGSSTYIGGATDPDYVVTTDDVDNFIVLECVPVDDQGQEGDPVRVFANDGKKIMCGPEQSISVQLSSSPMMLDEVDSSGLGGPAIEGFQIVGRAEPGRQLSGCGYSVNGTSSCFFQWVRFYPDGSYQYITGANEPYYVVKADDVGKFIALECIPMDRQGRQGDLVRAFANDHKKIRDVMQGKKGNFNMRRWIKGLRVIWGRRIGAGDL